MPDRQPFLPRAAPKDVDPQKLWVSIDTLNTEGKTPYDRKTTEIAAGIDRAWRLKILAGQALLRLIGVLSGRRAFPAKNTQMALLVT